MVEPIDPFESAFEAFFKALFAWLDTHMIHRVFIHWWALLWHEWPIRVDNLSVGRLPEHERISLKDHHVVVSFVAQVRHKNKVKVDYRRLQYKVGRVWNEAQPYPKETTAFARRDIPGWKPSEQIIESIKATQYETQEGYTLAGRSDTQTLLFLIPEEVDIRVARKRIVVKADNRHCFGQIRP